MGKIKTFFIALVAIILMPVTVFAANEKINVYIFRGEGCGYCASALEFFNGLDDEYKSYFNLVEREVWNNKDNAAKMQEVADYFNDDLKGVPYIIIGEQTFKGFAEEYEEDIKAAIKAGYENTDGSYKDVVAPILNNETPAKKSNAAVTVIILIVAVAGVGFLIYMARDDNSDEEDKDLIAEKEETPVVEEKNKNVTSKKTTGKSTAKNKTTSKKKTTSTKKTSQKK